MRNSATRTSAIGRLRLTASLLAATATIVLLALVPTVQAQTSVPTVTVPPPAQVESVLAQTPLGSLPAGQLTEALSHLEGLEGIQPATLEEALTKLIAELTSKGATLEGLLGSNEAAKTLREKLDELVGPVAAHLEEVLGENTQAKLTEALSSANVSELLGRLLGGSTEPQTVIQQVLQALGPERLQSLLGSVPTGEPFSKLSEEELAHQFGTTPEALAAQLGKTAEQLPGTATALLAPLANGEKLAVIPQAGGTTLALLKGATETVGNTGGNGGPGGSGSGTTTPGATVTFTTTTPAPSSPSPTAGVAGAKAGKLRLISHKVRGAKATVVIEVPSAGSLTAAGKGLRKISRETAKGERVTIHPALSRAGTSSLRKHHRRLKVPVKVSFKQVTGQSSSTTVALLYR
jgi:hypothetical protein